jgi:hypothetical protein
VNRVHVGDAEPARGEELLLVGGQSGLRVAHGRGARRVDHSLDLGAEALLEDRLGSADIDLEEPLAIHAPDGRHARRVEHLVDALQCAPDRAPIEDVAADSLGVEVANQLVVGALLNSQAQVVAALGQEAGDV